MFILKNEEDIENFIEVCEHSNSMSEAASKLNLNFKTFIGIAKKLNCYRPKQNWRKDKVIKDSQTFVDRRKEKLQKILNGECPEYQPFKLKNLLFEFGLKINRCEKCGISSWNNQPLNCELHHKDGNTHNHRLDNLEILCPNCHSQTDTFRAKNKTYRK